MTRRYRVAQWATGNTGQRALREVIRHPSMDLVGVLVYDPAKDGVDAGELCGEAPVGIKATTDRAAIMSLGADCVVYTPDEWTATGGCAAAREDTAIVSGLIKAGTAAAQKVVITGRSAGKDVVKFTQYAYVTMDTDPAWDLRPTGWRVRVHGDAPFDIAMPLPVALDDLASYVPAYNANGPVNAIPYVCEARPGILTTEDLPVILPRGPRPA